MLRHLYAIYCLLRREMNEGTLDPSPDDPPPSPSSENNGKTEMAGNFHRSRMVTPQHLYPVDVKLWEPGTAAVSGLDPLLQMGTA